MDFEKQLVDSSRHIAIFVAHNVGEDQNKFNQLMEVAFSSQLQLAMRASRVAYFCLDRHEELFVPHIKKVIHYALILLEQTGQKWP